MKTHQITGTLLILGVIGVLVPYTVLTMTFDYPDVLRRAPGDILTAFHAGGVSLIWTWWAFAILGLPLLVAAVRLGQAYPVVRWGTTLGVIGLTVQMIGLLRWVFVVPVLASAYVGGSEMTREAARVVFQAVHQYGGVVLGEHIGQLFTIAWTLSLVYAFAGTQPRWMTVLGCIASVIYLLAQAELFATVMPGFPVWEPAGFIGSTLWLVWLLLLGVRLGFVPASPARQGA
ncbi:MAG: DUF4386 domain-containing protein [Bacteroidia bacterium]|nr:DUF4386 domain-containing protein [Bacteroidia bacterium]